MANSVTPQDELIDMLASFQYRPRDFAYWAYPWGEEGTELAAYPRLEKWQEEVLSRMQEKMQDYKEGRYSPIREMVKSGHGVGKSALVAIINQWAMTTREGTRGVLTAGTETQLRSKTWVEMAKWQRLFIAKELFRLTASAYFSADKGNVEEWRIDIVPWSENNPEAFAGLHNVGKRVIVTLDEASGIAPIIHETAAGVDTDINTEVIRLQLGNPTDPDSYFAKCDEGGMFASLWNQTKVDSRDVTITNKEVIAEEIAIHGIDSDYIKVRRLGEFPSQSLDSFISRKLVNSACERKPPIENFSPLVMGLDIGRKNDPSVAFFRRGLDAQSIAPMAFRPQLDSPVPETMQVLRWILQSIAVTDPDTLCIDIGYIGAAVYDLLLSKRLERPIIYPVDFGSGASLGSEHSAEVKYANKRAQIYGRAKAWLHRGCIDNHKDFVEELCSPHYSFQGETTLLLESKEKIRKRLKGRSTDYADAFCCTFAELDDLPVEGIAGSLLHARSRWGKAHMVTNKPYDPFSEENIYGAVNL